MKKIFSFVAIAALVFGMASCNQPKPEPEPEPQPTGDTVLCVADAYYWNDVCADQGWWQIQAKTDEWFVTLSNLGDHAVAAGEYEIEEMDYDWSFFSTDLEGSGTSKEDQVHFVEGTLTVTVETNDAGKQISANVAGNLKGDDDKLYVIDLTWTKPADPIVAREQEITISEAGFGNYLASDGMFQIYGDSDDEEWAVGLLIESDTIAGSYTEEDLYGIGRYSYIENYVTEEAPDIFSAEITVTETEEEIKAVANILCYDSTLYKVTLTYAVPQADDTTVVVIANATVYTGYLASYGLYVVYGVDENNLYAQLMLYADEDDNLTDEVYSAVVYTDNDDDDSKVKIAKAEVTSLEAKADGSIEIKAELLGENRTLYDVTMTIPAAEESGAPRKASMKSFKSAKGDFKAAKSATRK